MHRIRAGIIRGGPSHEYDISLKTGANILTHLPADKFSVRDIYIDKNGVWYMHGIPSTPHEVLNHLDVVINGLHGNYGEDGKIQHIFETHGIPFTGSGSFASAMGMNKNLTKEIYKKEGLKSPQSRLIESLSDVSKEAHKIFQAFSPPMVVKPTYGGSSIGMTIAKNFSDFDNAVRKAYEHSASVMVEEYINGREASCVVVEDYRDQKFYTPPLVEVKDGNHISPGVFSDKEKADISSMAIKAHKALGLSQYSSSDFIIHPKRGIFILETDSQPAMTEESILPKALRSVGASLSHFLDHIVGLALNRK
jgi:D-alanine-D-alanine ligase